MKVLVTGATGGLGYRTLEKLSQHPDIEHIIANGRTIKPSHYIEHPKIEYALGSLEDQQIVDKITHQVDAIIHTAALSSPWGKYNDFKMANVVTQDYLLQAAIKQNIQRFIYISSPSLYFNEKDRLDIKETDAFPPTFINAYAQTKFEAEQMVINSSIPYVILRPRALIGRGDTTIMPRLIRAHNEGKLKVIGNGQNLVDLTSLANAVDAIELALFTDEKGINQAYNITNGDPVLLWKTIEDVLQLLGQDLNKKKAPYGIVKLVAQLMEFKSRMTNFKEPALTVYGIGTLAKSFTMDITKAKDKLGYSPRISVDEAMQEFVNWYQ